MLATRSPYCREASGPSSQFARWPEKTIMRRPARARSKCSKPTGSTGPPGANTSMPRRCGYSAATRPRLSHMPRTMRSISPGDRAGKAKARLRRARREMPSRGPTARPSAPPSAEARPSGNRPKAAKKAAAPQAWTRSDHSAIGERRQHGGERLRVAPGDGDVEHRDAGARRRGEPHPVLRGGDQPGTLAFGEAVQAGKLAGAVAVVVGKRPRRDELGAEPAQQGEEFLRPAD